MKGYKNNSKMASYFFLKKPPGLVETSLYRAYFKYLFLYFIENKFHTKQIVFKLLKMPRNDLRLHKKSCFAKKMSFLDLSFVLQLAEILNLIYYILHRFR